MRKKLDLAQLLTLGAVLVSLAFAIPQACTAQATLEETRNQREADRAQTDLDRQGQLTDRFSKAIEQLGSDKLQIRLGGIYALERIAHDSERDYPTVRNVLTTFVREETTALRPPQGGSCRPTSPAADVQVTALGHPRPRGPAT